MSCTITFLKNDLKKALVKNFHRMVTDVLTGHYLLTRHVVKLTITRKNDTPRVTTKTPR